MATTSTKANIGDRTYRKRLGKQEERIVNIAEDYSPATPGDWSTAPTTQDGALDLLAAEASGAATKTVTATWDESVDGDTGTLDLSVDIPDNAIIKSVDYDVLVAPAGATDIKFNLPSETASDGALGAGNLTATLHAESTGPAPSTIAASKLKTTAARDLSIVITGTATAGKIKVFVEYLISE